MGAPSPSRGEVRRIKVTDGSAMAWKRHMCFLHGREVGVGGHQGLTAQTGEKSPMAYKPDKARPESEGGQ